MLAERQHDEARAVLDVWRLRVERQESGARMLAQQERERGADSGVGETGQRLSRRNDVPNAADIRKRNQERGFALGATKRRHEIRLVLVASREERLNERIERVAGRTLEQPDEPRRVFLSQRPEIRRMIGEAEKNIARAAAFEFGLKLSSAENARASSVRRRRASAGAESRGASTRLSASVAVIQDQLGGGQRLRPVVRRRQGQAHAKPRLIVLEVDCSAMHARDRGGERKS